MAIVIINKNTTHLLNQYQSISGWRWHRCNCAYIFVIIVIIIIIIVMIIIITDFIIIFNITGIIIGSTLFCVNNDKFLHFISIISPLRANNRIN